MRSRSNSRYPSKNGHDHFARVRGGIRPRLRDGLKAGSGVADHFDYIEQIAGGTGKAIELPDGNHVAFAEVVEHAVELWPVAVRAGDLLAKDTRTSCLLQASS
jgi:hypothetical protein